MEAAEQRKTLANTHRGSERELIIGGDPGPFLERTLEIVKSFRGPEKELRRPASQPATCRI
jgi:hypothetical protein